MVVCPKSLISIFGTHSALGINGQRVLWMEMIPNMQGENDFEIQYSIDQLVLVVQKGQEVVDSNITNVYFYVNFNIGQFEIIFVHIVQIFIDVFCKFAKYECHKLFSSFQVNLNDITQIPIIKGTSLLFGDEIQVYCHFVVEIRAQCGGRQGSTLDTLTAMNSLIHVIVEYKRDGQRTPISNSTCRDCLSIMSTR